jgi:CheY-like chemotaxis protein
MSHELRTPLNSLLILAEQLGDDPGHTMSETQREYASVILASGRDLLTLLNGILELAKVESGTVVLETTEVSLDDVRAVLLREFEPVAEAKGLGFSIDVAPSAPDAIRSDLQRLRQILTNLLANAFKFTERGTVQLRVSLAEGGWSPEAHSLAEARSVVAFAVEDSGIGIEDDEQRRIFEAFAQGDGSTGRKFGGTGLGLSISRELVGLLKGEIAVTSSPGEGSTFTVYLPLEPGDAASAPTIVSAASPSPPQQLEPLGAAGRRARELRSLHLALEDGPFEGRTVLVVDDDFRNVFAMTALLERGRARVLAAESGADAIATLRSTPGIDLILMDIMMPEMDGYATMRAIREHAEFAALPIIALTGKVVEGVRERCSAAGADDYVAKPVDTDKLLAAIGRFLPAALRPAA